MHVTDHVHNAGFTIFGLEQRVGQAQDCGAAGWQGEQRPAWQGLKALATISHMPQAGQLSDGQFKGQHHQSGGHASNHAQDRVGQDGVVVGQATPVIVQQLAQISPIPCSKKPILTVISTLITFILHGPQFAGGSCRCLVGM